MGASGQRHAPAAFLPGKNQYWLYRGLGEPQGRSRRVKKISLAPGFDPRTVQLVASRYTDWAIPAHPPIKNYNLFIINSFVRCVNCEQQQLPMEQNYRVIKKSLYTWWLQYRKLQVTNK
jgi:hypothetical protein